MTTKAEFDRAKDKGRIDRLLGVKRHNNPYKHRGGRDGELLREQWEYGWDEEDARHAH